METSFQQRTTIVMYLFERNLINGHTASDLLWKNGEFDKYWKTCRWNPENWWEDTPEKLIHEVEVTT